MKRKEIDMYCYSALTNGDIELYFQVAGAGGYKLVIKDKDIKKMNDTSNMMKQAKVMGYFKEKEE
nr:MAG: hypothetical protein [Bacteriophage sp.]